MALNIIKEIRNIKENKRKLEDYKALYFSKKESYNRAQDTIKYLQNKLQELHEENLMLKGELKRQEMVMDFVLKQNTDVILAASTKKVVPPTISVTEVKADGKAQSSNS